MATSDVIGVLLAAGAGRRAGGPKALRRDADGTSWSARSAHVLLAGGCSQVLVVLGSSGPEAADLLADELRSTGPDRGPDDRVSVVHARDWAVGLSSSLRTGLLALHSRNPRAALIHLVDLPDVTEQVVRRLLTRSGVSTSVLARASYAGRSGHPVLIGADHLVPLITELASPPPGLRDAGAKAYLARHHTVLVECGDLASGEDRDSLG